MINIWDYKNATKVKIKTHDGKSYVGLVAALEDYMDLYDESDPEYGDDNNDQITILTKENRHLGFRQKDIMSITDLSGVSLPQAVGQ